MALSLLRAIAEGEQRALAQLFRMTSGRTVAYLCRVLRDHDSVEDILIDTYVEVWRRASHFDGRSEVLTWIIGIARNLAMNWLKRHREYASLDAFEDEVFSEDPLEDHFQRALVWSALNDLPENHREILALALLREFPYEQIAALLHIPVATVKTRVFYAKAAMREQLRAMGVARADVL